MKATTFSSIIHHACMDTRIVFNLLCMLQPTDDPIEDEYRRRMLQYTLNCYEVITAFLHCVSKIPGTAEVTPKLIEAFEAYTCLLRKTIWVRETQKNQFIQSLFSNAIESIQKGTLYTGTDPMGDTITTTDC